MLKCKQSQSEKASKSRESGRGLTILLLDGGCRVADPLPVRWTRVWRCGLISCDPCGLSVVHVLAAHRTVILKGNDTKRGSDWRGTASPPPLVIIPIRRLQYILLQSRFYFLLPAEILFFFPSDMAENMHQR